MTAIGTVGTVAIAGCTGSSEGGGSGDDSTDQNSNSTTPEVDNASTSEASDTSTPETVTRQFWEALVAEDYSTANELLHPGSLNYPLDESDVSIPDKEVSSVETVTYDEANERMALGSEDEFDKIIEERTGAPDYTIVYVNFSDVGTITPVVEDDGELRTVYLR